MSGFQDLKDLFRRRLLAAARRDLSGQTTTCEYEEELHRQRKLLDVILTPEIKLQRTDIQQLLVSKEELPSEQQEWNPGLDQEDPEPLHIKEEQEELWSSQEGEQLQGLEEADSTDFPFTHVIVKSEDDEEEPQSSQLHQRQNEQMETGVDGEDCGRAEPEIDSDLDRYLQPEIEVKTEDSSEPETEDSVDWTERIDNQPGINSNKRLKSDNKSHSCSECSKYFKNKRNVTRHIRIHTGEKPFSCSFCSKGFNQEGHLSKHMSVHTGQKPFICTVCSKMFKHISSLTLHMAHHRGDKPFSCSVCAHGFSWRTQLRRHKCVGALELHQNQTEENRKAETVAYGEDCGAPEPKRGSDPERHLQPETEVKTEASSGPESDDWDNDWKETREHQSGLDSLEYLKKRLKIYEKSHSCNECGKMFKNKRDLTQHIRIHTGEKPFSCSDCGRRFNYKSTLKFHTARHRGDKPFSCSVCDRRFCWPSQLKSHKCVGGQALEFHQNQTEEKREAETEADVEDCGGAIPVRNSDPERHLQPKIEVKIEDSSDPDDCVHSVFLSETMVLPSGLNSEENIKDQRPLTDKKQHSCSDCDKTFQKKYYLTRHIRIHRGEKPFSCSDCDKRFNQKEHLARHMFVHSQAKPFICSVCYKRFNQKSSLTRHRKLHWGEKIHCCSVCGQSFSWHYQLKKHKCGGGQASDLHQNKTKEKREAETGADGKDCGKAEPEWNSDPERHLQPETQVKTEDSSEPDTQDSYDLMKISEHQSGLNSVENIKSNKPNNEKKSHSCYECGKTFKKNRDLNQHIRIHTGEKPFSCSDCGKRFNHKWNLTTHILVHTGEKPFNCSVCSKRFKHKSSLSLHMAHHRGEKPYSCCICSQSFSWLKQLKTHKCVGGQVPEFHQNLTEEKREAETGAVGAHCGGAEPERKTDPERHLQETEDKPEDSWGADLAQLEEQVPLVQRPQSLTQVQFPVLMLFGACHPPLSVPTFPVSLKSSHLTMARSPKGKKSEKTEDSPEPGSENSVNFQTETGYQSGVNSVKYTTNKRLKTHKKSHSCSECQKTFRTRQDLTRHIQIHTGEKPFSCSICGKRFYQKWNLTSHMLVHTGEKPFGCSVCSKRFILKGNLTKHMVIHTGEKPFSCSECGKRFYQQGNLTSHMLIHMGVKPFSCSECGKEFRGKGNLNRHIKAHAGEKA